MGMTKTVIVTGASSGIGLATAQAYLELGHNVVGNSRSLERLKKAKASIGSPEKFLLVEGDIARPETSVNLFDTAVRTFGRVDVLIANAGIFFAKPTVDLSVEDVDAMLDTNIKGFFHPAREAAKHMTANGSGHIVATTACIAMQPNAKMPCLLTAITKGGLNHAVKALAIELAASGVQVNAVAPGVIDTPMLPREKEKWDFFRTMAPTGKTGTPRDIVDAILYLTGSDYVTGSIMTVDGGSTAGVW